MTPPRPTPLGDEPPISEVLADASGLLVATDFDGTLAPIREDPDAPLADPESRRALRRLSAHPATVVAVVSGRSISDLRPRVGVPDIVYAGNHGLEIDRGSGRRVHAEARRLADEIDQACRAVGDVAGPGSGVRVQPKGLTATIHLREAPPGTREGVLSVVEDAVDDTDAIEVSEGKAIVELRPAVEQDKGSVIEELADDMPDGWRLVYLGDDDTDEDAFDALRERADGSGIHVGTRPDTAASYRLAEQALVPGYLNALAAEIHGEARWSTNGGPPKISVSRPPAREEIGPSRG